MRRTKRKSSKEITGVEKINPELEKLAVPISGLKQDDRNARVHNKRNIEAIKGSLSQFGQQKPIVALKSGKVIAGNGTLLAATELGWKMIACVRFDTDDEARAAAYAIADNRTGELAEWDFEMLSGLIKELHKGIDFGSIGWEDYELEPMMEAEWNPPRQEDMDSLNTGKHGAMICKFRDRCDEICLILEVKEKDRFLSMVRDELVSKDES